jgi:hypothetical protein
VPTTGHIAGIPTEVPPPGGAPPESFADKLAPDEHTDLLYQPTWWELNMSDATAPPPHDTELREHYREHRDVTRRRDLLQPPPF